MKIGIVGTGVLGSVLAEKLSQAGHDIKVNNTKVMPDLEKIAAGLGATAATIQDVVQNVDAIIFSLPFYAYKNLPKTLLHEIPQDVVIMDTSNYSPFRDGEITKLEYMSESEYISKILNRPLVKVFNNILEYTLKNKGRAAGTKDRIAISIAGDNVGHKKVVAQLVDQIGFDTVDGGSLADSWRQQLGTPAFCTELNEGEIKQALLKADKEKAPVIRNFILNKLSNMDGQPSYEEILALNRSVASGNLH